MTFELNHLHIKSPDPERTAKFYVDRLGAEILDDFADVGVQLNLHGLTINLTKFVVKQQRQQHHGIEHIALDVDDFDEAVSELIAGGAVLMEQQTISGGRRICFLEGPDAVQFELIETAS